MWGQKAMVQREREPRTTSMANHGGGEQKLLQMEQEAKTRKASDEDLLRCVPVGVPCVLPCMPT